MFKRDIGSIPSLNHCCQTYQWELRNASKGNNASSFGYPECQANKVVIGWQLN